MIRSFRYLMFLICAVQAFFGLAYILQLPFAVRLWPLPYTNTMSFLFIASIFLAAAASTFWCIATEEYGALTGVALDYLTIFIPITVFVFQMATTSRNNESLIAFGISCVLVVIFGLGLFLWSRRIPIQDTRPIPRLVYWSFVVIIIALVIAGGQLVLKGPNLLPWTATLEGRVIYGWIFLGAAAYFSYSLLRPSWHNAAGQLMGFLAYDVVLIVPFLTMLPTIAERYRPNLIIYTAVISYSALLAIYYLFINPQTRLWRTRPAMQPVVPGV